MSDGFDGVAPGDEVSEEVPETGGGLGGRGASAPEGNGEFHTDQQVAIVVRRVLRDQGLASGEALVGVVGDGEIGLGGGL